MSQELLLTLAAILVRLLWLPIVFLGIYFVFRAWSWESRLPRIMLTIVGLIIIMIAGMGNFPQQ